MIVVNACTRPSSSGGACRGLPAVWLSVPAACAAGAAAAGRRACCVPMIQPRITPKHMPAMTYAIESAFIGSTVYGLRSTGHTKDRRPETILFHRQGFQVVADAALQAHEQRVADERVADRDLIEVRESPEQDQIFEVEIVAGVDP